jgi:hypothetical protein
VDFTTATSQVLVVIESLPQIIYRLVAGLGTSVNEDTNLRLLDTTMRLDSGSHKAKTYLQHLANGVEEPSVRVDLLLVLGLENEDNLDGY